MTRIQKRILVTAREYGTFIPMEEPGAAGDRCGMVHKTGIRNVIRAEHACHMLIEAGLIEKDGYFDRYRLTQAGTKAAADLPKTYLPAALR